MTLSTQALLGTLERLGVTITPTETGNLRITPASLVPDDLKAQLKEHKAELLQELSARTSPDPATIGQQPGHCGSCQHFTPNAPDFPEHFGTCTLGWVNHTGELRKDPVYLTCHATCMARNGTAWKERTKPARTQE